MPLLQKLALNGTETGSTAGKKINLLVDEVNRISSAPDSIVQVQDQILANTTDISLLKATDVSLQQQITDILVQLDLNNQTTSGIQKGGIYSRHTTASLQLYPSTVFSVVNLGGSALISKENGTLSYSEATGAFTATEGGIFHASFVGSGSGQTQTGATPTISFFVNGVDTSGVNGSPVFNLIAGTQSPIVHDRFLQLSAGDVVDLRVKDPQGAWLLLSYACLTLKKELI
jgi:hypothetical protein